MFQGKERGFTLIELSIVLVIIGLIVGGILTGRDLIKAAEVRAQITQIEKYNTAANTFRGKYGYLPGDIPSAPAAQFGFASRGAFAGEGDGNGVIEGNSGNCSGCNNAYYFPGESSMFWVDLSAARLIDGGFSVATATTDTAQYTYPISAWLPAAKLSGGMYIHVSNIGGINKFFIASISIAADNFYNGFPMLVSQAYAIDKKIDDGLPGSGTVRAEVISPYVQWAGEAYNAIVDDGTNGPYPYGVPADAYSCFDNSNNPSTPFHYSIAVSNGANPNCALSFKMQAGD